MKQLIFLKSLPNQEANLEKALNQIDEIITSKRINSLVLLLEFDHHKISLTQLKFKIQKYTLPFCNFNAVRYIHAFLWVFNILLMLCNTLLLFIHPALWIHLSFIFVIFSLLTLVIPLVNTIYRWIVGCASFQDASFIFNFILLILILISNQLNDRYQLTSFLILWNMIYYLNESIHSYIHSLTIKPIVKYYQFLKNKVSVKEDDQLNQIPIYQVIKNDTLHLNKGETILVDGIITNGNASLSNPFVPSDLLHVFKSTPIVSGYKVNEGSIDVKVTQDVYHSHITYLINTYLNSLSTVDLSLINHQLNQSIHFIYAYLLATFIGIISSLYMHNIKYCVYTLVLTCIYLILNDLFNNINIYRNYIYTSFNNHILIQNSTVLNKASMIDTIYIPRIPYIFDKYQVCDVLVCNDIDQTTFHHLLYLLHKRKKDDLSLAIQQYLKLQQIKDTNLSITKSIFSKGSDALHKIERLSIYSLQQCQESSLDLIPFKAIIDTYLSQGKTLYFYVNNSKIIGMISLNDIISGNFYAFLKNNSFKLIYLDDLNLSHGKALSNLFNIDTFYLQDDLSMIKQSMINAQFNQAKTIALLTNPTLTQLNQQADLSISLQNDLTSDIYVFDHHLETLSSWLHAIHLNQSKVNQWNLWAKYLPLLLTIVLFIFTFIPHITHFYTVLVISLFTLLFLCVIRFMYEYQNLHLNYSKHTKATRKTLCFTIENCQSEYDITKIKEGLTKIENLEFSFNLLKKQATVKVDTNVSIETIEQTIDRLGYKISR